MTGHVDQAVHALLDERLQVSSHVGPLDVFLGSLFLPHQVSPVVSVKDLLDVVPQRPRDDHPCLEVAVMVGDNLHVILDDDGEVLLLGEVGVE